MYNNLHLLLMTRGVSSIRSQIDVEELKVNPTEGPV
jgi:hypothetical protein